LYDWNEIDNVIILLYYMIMNYYKAIEFLGWAHRPECRAWVDKHFEYYVLDYAESGSLMWQAGADPLRRLRGPVVFLTFPGPRFRFGRRRAGYWNHRFISFRGPQADRFAITGLFPSATPVVRVEHPQRFSRAFDELLDYMAGQPYGMPRAAHMLAGLLLQLHEQAMAKPRTAPDVRIARALGRIAAAPETAWDLPRLAVQSGLSYPHFRRLFRQATGMPPGDFVVARRMEKAGGLLRQPAPPALKEVAALCGYPDIYHFSKSFRCFHGLPPGRYRDNFQLP